MSPTIRLLLFSILLKIAHICSGENVLLIGDSVDRCTVFDWCKKENATIHAWGDNSIKYGGQKGTKMPSAYCELENGDSIAFLHIFGSSGTGPYLYIDTRGDPYAATTPRIIKALQLYNDQIGLKKLTKIIFSSILWDFRPYRSDVLDYNYEQETKHNNHRFKTFPEFRNNYIAEHKNTTYIEMQRDIVGRLYDIAHILSYHVPDHSIQLGLRTAAWYEDGGLVIHAMNDLVRSIVKASADMFVPLDSLIESLPLFATHSDLSDTLPHLLPFTDLFSTPRTSQTPSDTFLRYWKSIHGHDSAVPTTPIILPTLEFYDLDRELWSHAHFDYVHHSEYFRDDHHPSSKWLEHVGSVYMSQITSLFRYSSTNHRDEKANHDYHQIGYHQHVEHVHPDVLQ